MIGCELPTANKFTTACVRNETGGREGGGNCGGRGGGGPVHALTADTTAQMSERRGGALRGVLVFRLCNKGAVLGRRF